MEITNNVLLVGLPIAVNLLGLAVVWGKLTERVDVLKQRLDNDERVSTDMSIHLNRHENENQRTQVALWGIDGQNGLRGNLKELSGKVDTVQADVGTVKVDIRSMENQLQQIMNLLNDR